MSRRERISDFTRPATRSSYRSFSRSNYSGPGTRKTTETTNIKKNASLRNNLQEISRPIPKAPPAYPKQNKSVVLKRSGLNKLPEFKPKKTKKKVNVVAVTSTFMVLLLLIVSPYLVFRNFNQSKGIVLGVKKIIGGANDEPKYLISSSIMDVPAKVEVINSLDDNSRSLQDSNKIGWYKNSSKSGDNSAMIFAGYVSGPNNTGALMEIKNMKQGDYIQIETGDGQILRFKVKEVKKVIPSEFNINELSSNTENKDSLNIVSYTDITHKSNSDLSDYRYVVYATKE